MTRLLCVGAAAVALLSLGAPAVAQTAPEPKAVDADLFAKGKKSIDNGLRFLRYKQKDDGSYENHVGITATVLLAFTASPRNYKYDEGPFVALAADWLATQARPDGAISGKATPTYNTALAIMALQALHPAKFRAQIEGGQRFLVTHQLDETKKYTPKDKKYGGVGYGEGEEPPDLSNLQYAVEALRVTGYDPTSDVWAKAQKFIDRCQNRSESNDQEWAGNDGGFIYAPGRSPAGGTMSYGAMTFAGLKSLIFSDVKKEDPRVKAAMGWIKKNYAFNRNPGMGNMSLFYYYQTAATALHAYGQPYLGDPKARTRNWAADLAEQLLVMQSSNGSWVNENPKYWEGNRIFTTARAIVALNYALKDSQ